ncbi:MAG: hypothetical protein R3C56_17660 [Pirellulaceae bacterium]
MTTLPIRNPRSLNCSLVRSELEVAASNEARFNERVSQSEAIRAQADQATRLLREINRNDEGLKQLVEQFNFLMAEQRYLEASKDVAPVISQMSPGTALDNLARVESSIASNEALSARPLKLANRALSTPFAVSKRRPYHSMVTRR